MIYMLESSIRGGICQVVKRLSRCNNKYSKKTYNSKEKSKYLLYLDVNNLYGHAQRQSLPFENFRWLEQQEIDSHDVSKVSDDSDKGYILEVDLHYPQSIHDNHQDLPLAPERLKPPNSKYSKLLTTLYDKQKYVIHYRNLKQCLELGMVLTKIHKVIEFSQSKWMSVYVDLCADLRKKAANDFEKNLYKLLVNAVFGKSIENLRKHTIVKLARKYSGRHGAQHLISKPNFHSCEIFDENLVAVELKKTEILFNKPIYIGFSTLEISKSFVYDFHYNFMNDKFKCFCLLYMDTDSFIYEIYCDDVYDVIKENIDIFDTSDFNHNNPYRIPLVNKKKIGNWKDECAAQILTDYVGLKPKMYALKIEGEDRVRKSKGIKRCIVKTITFEDYVDVLQNQPETPFEKTQNYIRSKKHCVCSIEQSKVALSYKDDKRYVLSNQIDTLPMYNL
ncbi:hypothetical protein ILUMI_07955 [Ignelater luminosus]|uniref:DNA-directed DNA polymerase n=1 Tax=Ignelater luminosus TaxID=2038154 RepID=A0A8K0D789_IGNLU|nr:hypothetical protein ILUMI_07955 [Ignelater luminosus]